MKGSRATTLWCRTSPGRSKLMYMLRGEETLQMPPDVPLPEVEISFVERWIAEGAQCD